MTSPKNILLIGYSKEIIDGEPIYVSSNSLPIKATKYDPAGHAFHAVALKLLGVCEKKEEDEKVECVANAKDEQTFMPSSESYSTKGKKKAGKKGDQQDHYALLNLGHLRYLATEEQIRKSYRDTALKYHPDKQAALLLSEKSDAAKQRKKDEIENHFRSIQEGYEILIDPVKRRVYDSTDEFDDEIPTDCAPQDFFKVFGPAFMRNGRWSVNQPIPSVGDENTPFQEVDTFYNFWYNFKSWREFPHEDEHDLEQAESRDEKRWMERQNAKLSEKPRKEDYARIRSLVDSSYKRDPRILRRKEELKAEKQRKREAKYMEKRLQEEEAARVLEEERRCKEEEEKRTAEAASQQKKLREKEKKLLRKEKSRLRTLSSAVLLKNLLGVTSDDVENLCTSLSFEQLKSLCDRLEGKREAQQAKLLRDPSGCDDSIEDEKQGGEETHENGSMEHAKSIPLSSNVKKDKAHENGSMEQNGHVSLTSYEKKEKPWGKEEITLLRKGVKKYPKGTSRRWEVISAYIGTDRSVEEILKATKTVLLQKPDSNKAFDSFLEKRKPTPSIVSPLSTREETEKSLIPPTPEVHKAKIDNSDDSSRENSSKSSGNVIAANGNSSIKTASKLSDNVIAANGDSSSLEKDQWSAIQEKALVLALKTFPKEENKRWERIATAVPGKTVNQCKKKFTLLKENFRFKKTAE